MEAEMLAKKAFHLTENENSPLKNVKFRVEKILVDILQFRNHDDEAKDLLERVLATRIQEQGVDCREVVIDYQNLSLLHRKLFMKLPPSDERIKQLNLARLYAKKAVHISQKIFDSGNFFYPMRLSCEAELLDLMGLP
jgi:hypothetical protein